MIRTSEVIKAWLTISASPPKLIWTLGVIFRISGSSLGCSPSVKTWMLMGRDVIFASRSATCWTMWATNLGGMHLLFVRSWNMWARKGSLSIAQLCRMSPRRMCTPTLIESGLYWGVGDLGSAEGEKYFLRSPSFKRVHMWEWSSAQAKQPSLWRWLNPSGSWAGREDKCSSPSPKLNHLSHFSLSKLWVMLLKGTWRYVVLKLPPAYNQSSTGILKYNCYCLTYLFRLLNSQCGFNLSTIPVITGLKTTRQNRTARVTLHVCNTVQNWQVICLFGRKKQLN